MPRTEPPAAMRVGRDLAQRVLLPTGAGEPGEPGSDAAAGRIAFGTSPLWESATDGAVAARGPGGQSQTSGAAPGVDGGGRSEEHTSELQSLRHLVCRLL